ncbi:acidic leucine-rich nuclear phosphoprotein 32 family member e [Stylonychia lemnae]|uniref:Acidic leucine-rich nuclear phosphoprotein 32 family member e n=1 Tax=Stylonychia lemnae TaxID=5949 RepID=A0A078A8X1_STYLE|nr:acidic leucine-rich nuclear phosphoprotein 32 family member e [Stylonychia lemnae]|eukprot:CDW77248.1 acidic leucine-rich nuclear phosphoprotein 32 family member e [Stylonychia lemnae]
MGKMAKLLTFEQVTQGGKYPMILERTILQRVPEGKEIDPTEYEHLLLDGVTVPDIFEHDREFLEQFINVTSISFNSCCLKSLTQFPKLDKVIKIELQDNKIQKGLEILIERCPNVEILKLGNNQINSLKEVQKLGPLRNLRHLDLIGNPLCEIINYTDKIFQVLPDLHNLDGQDQEGNEVITDEEDINEENDLDDYGDEQDMIADGVLQDQNDQDSGSNGEDDQDEKDGDDEEEDNDSYEDQKSSEESDPGDEGTEDEEEVTRIQKLNQRDSQEERLEQEQKLTYKKMKMLEYSSGSDQDDGEHSEIINLGKRKARALKSCFPLDKRLCTDDF